MRTKNQVGLLILSLILCLLVVPVASTKTTLSISSVLAWFTGDPLKAGAKAFLERHPDVELSIQGKGPDDLIVQIAAGSPPDIIGLPGAFLSSWAVQGLIQPLTAHVERGEVNPEDFIPPAWKQCLWDSEVWALPVIVDPNFALLYNRHLFAQAGLDPSQPPEAIKDLDVVFKRLTLYESDGSPN